MVFLRLVTASPRPVPSADLATGFVLFMVCRECIYYINLRQAYLLSPNYSKRLSSRTVLFTCIPKPYVDEARLRKLFGDSVKNVWIARDTSALRALVEDRDETADRLQKAEVKLIRLANAAREQCLRRQSVPPGPVDLNAPGPVASAPTPPADPSQHDAEKGQAEAAIQFAEPQLPASESPSSENLEESEYRHPYGLDPSLPDVRGSVAAQWIPAASRPYHRPLRNFGRRVDTIRWTRARLKVLNRDIWKLRRSHRRGDGAPLNAAFVEFDSQASAQAAFQILAHHQPLHMSPRYIGPQPDEVIWGALRIRWWEHIMRRFFIMGVIAAAVIFWSVPAAFVGGITNVQSLSSNVFFLAWIEKLPGPILGIIQGLLPALALSWLMAAVPWMLRGTITQKLAVHYTRALTDVMHLQVAQELPACLPTRWSSCSCSTPTLLSRWCRCFSSRRLHRLLRRHSPASCRTPCR